MRYKPFTKWARRVFKKDFSQLTREEKTQLISSKEKMMEDVGDRAAHGKLIELIKWKIETRRQRANLKLEPKPKPILRKKRDL